MRRSALFLVLTMLIASACSGDDEGEATTTTLPPLRTTTSSTAPGTGNGDGTATSTTSTTQPGDEPALPAYEIVTRIPGDSGDTVVVLLEADDVSTLTDIDLQNIVADVVERFPPVLEAHIVDSRAAANAVLVDEPSDDQKAELADHYLVRLEDGFRMVFTGPFSSAGISVLGS